MTYSMTSFKTLVTAALFAATTALSFSGAAQAGDLTGLILCNRSIDGLHIRERAFLNHRPYYPFTTEHHYDEQSGYDLEKWYDVIREQCQADADQMCFEVGSLLSQVTVRGNLFEAPVVFNCPQKP